MSHHAILRGVHITHAVNLKSNHATQRDGVHLILAGQRATSFTAIVKAGGHLHRLHHPDDDFAALAAEWKTAAGTMPHQYLGVTPETPAADVDTAEWGARGTIELLLPGRIDRLIGQAEATNDQPYAAVIASAEFLDALRPGDVVYRADSGPGWGAVPPQYKAADDSPLHDPATQGVAIGTTDLKPPPAIP